MAKDDFTTVETPNRTPTATRLNSLTTPFVARKNDDKIALAAMEMDLPPKYLRIGHPHFPHSAPVWTTITIYAGNADIRPTTDHHTTS